MNHSIKQLAKDKSEAIQNVPTKATDNNNYNEEYNKKETKHYEFSDHNMIKTGKMLNNKYSVIRKLGSGTFSTVWLCRNKNSISDFVAVKIAKTTEMRSARDEISYLRLVRGNHRFVKLINNFIAFSEKGLHVCLVLQVLNGTLLDLINKSEQRRISIPETKLIATQVLEGLEYLHNVCKLIHADIKPDNIHVLNDHGHISFKIADLGSAHSVENNYDGPIQAQGYRCPEVILAAGFGPTADIWSLACVIFQLATGDYLFRARACDEYSRDENHLALMIQLLGKMDKRLCLKTREETIFFLPNGDLRKVSHLQPLSLCIKLTKQYNWNFGAAFGFSHFLRPMLKYNPRLRVSAKQCLRHEWLKL